MDYSDSDDEVEVSSWKGVPGTVILINIFDPNNTNMAQVAQNATCALLKQHLRSSSSQNIGVCLYGADNADASTFDVKSVIEVFPLTVPSLQNYKELQKLDIPTVNQAKEIILSEALRHCSKMFTKCKKMLSNRTVLLLTDLRVPPPLAYQKPTLKGVKDIVDSNIDLKIVNISEKDYDIDPFYTDFLKEANKGDSDFVEPKPIWNVEEILRFLHENSHRHLAVARLNFEIGNDLCIGVGVYSLLKRKGQNSFKQSNLERSTNTVLTTVTKMMKAPISDIDQPRDLDEPEAKPVPVLKSELLHYQEFGGERVEFTDEEFKRMQNPFGPPMLRLLGFKPSSILKMEKWYFKPSYFLFPSESKVEGSIVAFKALHKACTEMSVIGICILCTRVNAHPSLVALSPCMKPLNLDIDIGFDVIHLPFVENVRDLSFLEDTEENVPTENEETVMSNLLNNLRFDYKPDMFENPSLQSKCRAVEAIALDHEAIEPFNDTTRPDLSVFDNIDRDMFENTFGRYLGNSVKRSANISGQGPPVKKPKAEINENLLQNSINHQTVAKTYTVTQLKQILRYKDIPNLPALTGLTKNELVDLVYQHCS